MILQSERACLNPKFEARNPKQIQMTKTQMLKTSTTSRGTEAGTQLMEAKVKTGK